MNSHPRLTLPPLVGLLLFPVATATAADSEPKKVAPEELRAAVERGLRRVETGAANYLNNRQCFSCHHQALPILSLTAARKKGFEVEAAKIDKQVEFSLASFAPKKEKLLKGQDVGGASTTVGYALTALEAAGYPADETTRAMVRFLLVRQRDDGAWKPSANRPPSEASSFTTTGAALRGLRAYGPKEADKGEEAEQLRKEASVALGRGRQWLVEAKPETTEDKVFRLFGLLAADAKAEDVRAAREQLLKEQRGDGGWAQLDDLESDAYATGSVMIALRAAGLPADDPSYQKGVRFLLKTQRDDGAWLVKTRSRPIQTFFDNGDPGDKSQFISFTATNWAVWALVEGVEAKKK